GPSMRLASRIGRVSTRLDEPQACQLILIGLPKFARSARLHAGEMVAPLRILRSSEQCLSYSRAMSLGIEFFSVAFPVVETNVLRRRHPLNVGRPVVATIEVQMMAMRARAVSVYFVPDVPLVRQSMRRIKMPVD